MLIHSVQHFDRRCQGRFGDSASLFDIITASQKGTEMKRTVLILVLFALLLAACDSCRDLSTPSSRLVGRWMSKAEVATEKYFSEIDPDTGEGTYIEYNLRDGGVFIMKYMIISESPAGEKLTILYWDPDGTRLPYADLVVQDDGLRAKFRDYYIEYIDNKTEFDVSDHPRYRVVFPTSLHVSPMNEFDLSQELSLDRGTVLIPANGESTLYCVSKVELGISPDIHACYMYSPVLGKNGWVWDIDIKKLD